jgi:hypothetical protein
MLVYEERVAMPMIPLLLDEMGELKIINDKKVDHPRKKSKDLSDAVCGAVFGAISFTSRNINQEVEVHTFTDRPKQLDDLPANVIQYKSIPDDVKDYLDRFNIL